MGSKFVLASKGILGGLSAFFAGGYILMFNQPPSEEELSAFNEVVNQTGNLIAGGFALVGGVAAIVGRLRAKKSLTIGGVPVSSK